MRQFDHLKDLRISELEDKSINILLDAKFAYFFFTGDIRKGREDQPIAWGTHFGHAIIGPEIVNKQNNNEILTISTEPVNISDHINQAFRQDFLCRNLKSFPQMVHKSVGLKILDWKTNFPDHEISSPTPPITTGLQHRAMCILDNSSDKLMEVNQEPSESDLKEHWRAAVPKELVCGNLDQSCDPEHQTHW